MEGFDIHRPYLNLELQEILKRKSLRLETVSQLPLPEDLERDLNCAVCRELAVLGIQWCHDGHLVCSSCIKEFCVGKDKTECSVVVKGPFGNYLCQKKLTGHDSGMPRHMDYFLQLLQPLPCGATKYGCTFTGRKAELLQHEINDCSYRKLRVCFLPGKNNEDPCAQRFATHEGLVSHWIDHGVTVQHDPRTVVHLNFKHPSDLSDEWVVIDRKLVDYPGDRFCVLTICENKTHIRMWLRETDHLADPAVLPFYFVSTPAESVHYLDCFRTRILPHSEKDLVTTDYIHAKEFKKNFLRVTADGSKDGNLYVSFAFEFLVTPTSEPSIKDNKSLPARERLIMKPTTSQPMPKESPATKEGPEGNKPEDSEQNKPEGPEEKKSTEGPEEKEALEGPDEMISPASEEKKSPATEEKKSPATEEKKFPTTEEKKFPATEEKKSPATEENETQGPEENDSSATVKNESPATEEKVSLATEQKQTHQHHDTQPNILKSGTAQQDKGAEATAGVSGSSNARDSSTRNEQHPKSPITGGRERGGRIRKRGGTPRSSSPWLRRDQNQSGEK